MIEAAPELSKDTSQDFESGYRIMEPYTWRFFDRQSPTALAFAAAMAGGRAPAVGGAFRYCELGCGNGVTVAALAAANPDATFFAADFNPAHIANARRLARAGGLTNISFVAHDFERVMAEPGEAYDIITAHGVLSWVAPDIQGQLMDALGGLLAPGGLAFMSYNCFPGWAPTLPLSRLMRSAAEGVSGTASERASAALSELRFLRDAGAGYFMANPAAAEHLDHLAAEDPTYVAHEFLNASFEPQYPLDVLRAMAKRDLAYAGSTDLALNDDRYTLDPRLHAYIHASPDRTVAEHRRSLARNDSFRDDIYTRPAADADAEADPVAATIIGPVLPDSQIDPSLPVRGRPAPVSAEVVGRLLPVLMEGRTAIGDLPSHPYLIGLPPAAVAEATRAAVLSGQFRPLRRPALAAEAIELPRLAVSLSRVFLNERLLKDGGVPLISPVLGSALVLPPLQSLCIWAIDRAGPDGAPPLILSAAAQRPDLFGALGVSEAWARALVADFQVRWVPFLARLGIVSG